MKSQIEKKMKIVKRKNRSRIAAKRHCNRNRKGAAVVEFAVCLPLILLVMLGSIEAANMMFLRQALVQSSYEGAKAAIKNDVDNATVEEIASLVAAGRRLENFSVRTIPADITSVAPGEMIRVISSAPVDSNSFITGTVFRSFDIEATAVMVKE